MGDISFWAAKQLPPTSRAGQEPLLDARLTYRDGQSQALGSGISRFMDSSAQVCLGREGGSWQTQTSQQDTKEHLNQRGTKIGVFRERIKGEVKRGEVVGE